MNPLDCLLRDELNRLLDRIAASTRAGVAKVSARQLPDLRARLDEAEARLAAKRQALLEQYAGWQEALDACEDLWAVAQLELEETEAGIARGEQAIPGRAETLAVVIHCDQRRVTGASPVRDVPGDFRRSEHRFDRGAATPWAISGFHEHVLKESKICRPRGAYRRHVAILAASSLGASQMRCAPAAGELYNRMPEPTYHPADGAARARSR